MYVQCVAMRRGGVKLSKAEVEAAIPSVGYLHLSKSNLLGADCLEAMFTESRDSRVGHKLPRLCPATVVRIKGDDMAISGMEQTSTANAMGPAYPQTWWVKVLQNDPPRSGAYPPHAPMPPNMTTLYS